MECCRALLSAACILLAAILIQSALSVNGDDGALISVEVQDENNTDVEIIVDSTKPTRSTESFLDPEAEPFIPTHEWQLVKPGQSVPSGLHIRMNFSSGEREAKLMEGDDGSRYQQNLIQDGTESSSRLKELKKRFEETMKGVDAEKKDADLKYWKEGAKQGILNAEKNSFTRSELKDALKVFKTSSDDPKIKKFRTATELKHQLKNLKLDMQTDLEIMGSLMKRYKQTTSTDDKQSVLEELEWMVHQIDNAHFLADSGGLKLVAMDLNSTDRAVSRAAAYLIGSAVQSNPKVQLAAMQTNILPLLLQMLSLYDDIKTQNKALYALSTLVRHFPLAQLKLAEGGGLQMLTEILRNGKDSKIKVKIITLLTDMATEKRYVDEQYDELKTDTLKKKKVPTATLR